MIKSVFVQSQAEKAIGQDHSAIFSYLMKLTEKTKLDFSWVYTAKGWGAVNIQVMTKKIPK